ncbi:(+)-neomenthol dehydrogenase-like [Coffea arabica]|uniref:(+)-neomenthol dehydrogenase-like n=1 Tax=Coffea arabica TaxID=13443 RepID=A0A6P6VK46_COFAR|nr:(+)-neomenthol dehydrogenase-like [Coffea arabica]
MTCYSFISKISDAYNSLHPKEVVLVNNAGAAGLMVEGDVSILKEIILADVLKVAGQLLSNEWAVEVLSDGESLTEERVDMVVTEFLKDFKDGTAEAKYITCNTGFFTAAEGAEGPVKLALLPDGGPSGLFFLTTY